MEKILKNNTDRVIQINTETLDHVLDLHNINQENLNWIKIDVEGAEFEVIKGAKNILSKSNLIINLLISISVLK